MSSIIITGKAGSEPIAPTINGFDVKATALEAVAQSGDCECATVVNYPASLEQLADTMACRGYFEELKNAGQATIMTASEECAADAPNWLMYYGMVLPFVDYFCASYDSALQMLEPNLYEDEKDTADPQLCDQMAVSLLNMGCAAVIFDLGEKGTYMRSSSVRPRFEQCGPTQPADIENWWARELYVPAQDSQATLENKTLALAASLLKKQNISSSLEAFATAGQTDTDTCAAFKAYAGWKIQDGVYLGEMDGKEA